MERRTDYKTALLIDAIVHAAGGQHGRAARELAGMGVPLAVAIRVLTRPVERRQPLPASTHPDIGRWRREG